VCILTIYTIHYKHIIVNKLVGNHKSHGKLYRGLIFVKTLFNLTICVLESGMEALVAEHMRDVDMSGQWSIDILLDDYRNPWLIDMAQGERSAYWKWDSAGREKPTPKPFIPKIAESGPDEGIHYKPTWILPGTKEDEVAELSAE